MNKRQQLSIIAFLVVLIGVYLFGKTKNPEADNKTADLPASNEVAPGFDVDSYLANINQTLAPQDQEKVLLWDSLINEENSNKDALRFLDSMIAFYTANRKFLAVAHFEMEKAEAADNFTQWKRSGDAYSLLSGNQNLPAEMYAYISGNGIDAYRKALELEPENVDVKVALASILMENDSEVMNGVQLLLGVVREDPNNAPANLLLGKYGVISGQFEKAINRLENVVSSQPENAEALFLLAEAYNGSGNKDKAIATFERCKQLIDNDAFRKEIDNYIESINNR